MKWGVAMATPHGRVLRSSLSDAFTSSPFLLSTPTIVRSFVCSFIRSLTRSRCCSFVFYLCCSGVVLVPLTALSIQADSQSLDSPSFQSSPKRKHRFVQSPSLARFLCYSLTLILILYSSLLSICIIYIFSPSLSYTPLYYTRFIAFACVLSISLSVYSVSLAIFLEIIADSRSLAESQINS